jgi:hypothetical protein
MGHAPALNQSVASRRHLLVPALQRQICRPQDLSQDIWKLARPAGESLNTLFATLAEFLAEVPAEFLGPDPDLEPSYDSCNLGVNDV